VKTGRSCRSDQRWIGTGVQALLFMILTALYLIWVFC